MTKTLLFDLDDTLIGNPMAAFVPAYSSALAKRIAPDRRDEMIRELFRATSHMMGNLRPDLTLEEVFDQHFFPALNTKRSEMQPAIDEFYKQDFPKLRSVTEYRSEAVEIVNRAVKRGWRIAVATNPLFPFTAIHQRLSWAGLATSEYPWILIPSYESFHFTKPNPEFFAELLGQIGWTEEPVIMIGNDKEMDIDSASNFGLAAYLVDPETPHPVAVSSNHHAQGKISDLFDWIDNSGQEILKPANTSNRALLAILRSTPAAAATLTRSLKPDDWNWKPLPAEWSITEILCHLRDVEAEVNLPRLTSVLSGDNPFITGQNTDTWVEERNYNQQNGSTALQQFTNFRMELVRILENLSEEEWSLAARHSIFGPIHLSELVGITTSHDKLHLNTIYKQVNTNYNRDNL